MRYRAGLPFLIALLAPAALLVRAEPQGPPGLPDGYWSEAEADAILARTLTVRLDPSLSGLTGGERRALGILIAAGHNLQEIYEDSRHHQAIAARKELEDLNARHGTPARTRKLSDLYRLFKGPIATTPGNRRQPFLPVEPERPGRNVYPRGVEREELDRFLADHPEARGRILHLRSVVRRTNDDNLARDLEALREHPALDTLHPGLRRRLQRLRVTPSLQAFYALPYSVAWADRIMPVYHLIHEAAGAVREADPAFARYLRLRARDLLADDYEGGDAAWVTGRFGRLNAQIGSYETYDDELYGVKSFFSMSLLLRDPERSEALRDAVGGLQAIEDALPYEGHKRVREDIPIGVYDVVADFGQARGANTATILPNETHLARQYGRTILLRANILTHPELFALSRGKYTAAVHADFHDDLTPEGRLQRTLWHEIGHYLGVDRTRDGRDLDQALQEWADLFEEMKSDLVSLFAVPILRENGYYGAAEARAVYADGIRRVLQKARPRREQPYQTMQLMQWNWFLEKGVLAYEPGSHVLRIDYERYPEAAGGLLRAILAIQQEGDRGKAERFIDRYTTWKESLHGVLAAKMRAEETARYVLVRYAALE